MKKFNLLSIVALALALTGGYAFANQDAGTTDTTADPTYPAQDVATEPAPADDVDVDADVDINAEEDDTNVDLNMDGDDDVDVTSDGIQTGNEADVDTEVGVNADVYGTDADLDADVDASLEADADALPRTASPLALLALLGAGGIGSAAGLRYARRK